MNSHLDEIIAYFEALQKEFHKTQGCMIHTLDDNLAKKYIAELSWNDCYNPYVPGVLLNKATLEIVVFGQIFQVDLWRPNDRVSKREFEEFFGFTYDQTNYRFEFLPNRVVAQFSKDINPRIDVTKLVSSSSINMRKLEDEKEDVINIILDKGLPEDVADKIFNILKKDVENEFVKNVLRLMVLGGYVKYWEAITKYQQWFKERGYNVCFNSTSALIFE